MDCGKIIEDLHLLARRDADQVAGVEKAGARIVSFLCGDS